MNYFCKQCDNVLFEARLLHKIQIRKNFQDNLLFYHFLFDLYRRMFFKFIEKNINYKIQKNNFFQNTY